MQSKKGYKGVMQQ